MGAKVFTVIKVPITEIIEWLRQSHSLPQNLESFSLETNELVLTFNDKENIQPSIKEAKAPIETGVIRTHRRARKRNRMKTRGWEVVGRIVNTKGQKCAIYKPFVDALGGKSLTSEEQQRLVESILRANKNKPSEESVRYFLENTLEFLTGKNVNTSSPKVIG